MTNKLATGMTMIFGVDPQNCFGHPRGGLYVKGGEKVVEPGNKLIDYGLENDYLIGFSCDWHPNDSDHFKPVGPWPRHGVAGTWDAEFLSGLNIPVTSYVFRKGTKKHEHGYDPFEGKTDDGIGLENVLVHFGIEKILTWGIAIDYCLKACVLHALKLGYKVYLVIDASRSVNAKLGDEQKAIEEMEAAGAKLITTQEVLNGKF